MARLNLGLLIVSVFCALCAVTAQHKARRLFRALEAEQERAERIEVEYGQFQLELSTWATAFRIEKIAREKLRMRLPEGRRVIEAVAEGGAR